MAGATPNRGRVDWRQVRVGTVIVVGLLLLAYAVLRVGSLFNVFADRYTLYTLVESAAGLSEGSPVMLAGQHVGQVAHIEFLPVGAAGPNHLVIRLSIGQEVHEQIRRDSRAFIRAQGLLGDKYINIEPGSPSAAILMPGDTLPTADAVDIDAMLAAAQEMMEQTAIVLDNLQTVTRALAQGEGTMGRLIHDDRLYAQLVDVSEETEALIAEARDADGTIGRLLRDPALYERMTEAVATLEAVGDTILHGGGTVSRLLRDPTLYESLLATAGRADTAITGISAFTERLAAGDGTLQRLLTDPELYDQFLKAVVDVQTLIRALREDPSQIQIRPQIQVDVF